GMRSAEWTCYLGRQVRMRYQGTLRVNSSVWKCGGAEGVIPDAYRWGAVAFTAADVEGLFTGGRG
ncbi:MAG: hypothetical protein NT154_10285, partial [Verrucomicrobia bacterium]|nr:hypothetical protein [Verrucomicrobiota bacterium]